MLQHVTVRIDQKFRNEVSVERPILADFAAAQRNGLKWKLSDSRKENMHRSIRN